MPVYEYRCEACGEVFELFMRSFSSQTGPECPECGSQRVRRAISLFGVGGAARGGVSEASCSPGPV